MEASMSLYLYVLPRPCTRNISVHLLTFNLFQWKLMEVDLLPWKLVEASMEIHGWNFPLSVEVEASCRWKWKLPLLSSVAASANIFLGSFHELSCTPTYLYLLPRESRTSSCLHKTNPNLNVNANPNRNPKLELPRRSWPTSNLHGN